MDSVEIDKLVGEVLSSGNWMLRRSDGGRAYGGFRWNDVGEWTEAPDFINNKECGFGLHGNGPNSSGYWGDGIDIDFCEVYSVDLVDLGDKVKCRRARILLRNELPNNLSVSGSLNLSHTQITKLPNNLSVSGDLDLGNTKIVEIPESVKIGGSVYR